MMEDGCWLRKFLSHFFTILANLLQQQTSSLLFLDMSFSSHLGVDVTVRRQIWEGSIPVSFMLAPKEVTTTVQPKPIFVRSAHSTLQHTKLIFLFFYHPNESFSSPDTVTSRSFPIQSKNIFCPSRRHENKSSRKANRPSILRAQLRWDGVKSRPSVEKSPVERK